MDNPNNIKSTDISEDGNADDASVSEWHRMAAHHLFQAAKQHLLAAEAIESDDTIGCDLHALRAYKHEINGLQFSELAMMDVSDVDDIVEMVDAETMT